MHHSGALGAQGSSLDPANVTPASASPAASQMMIVEAHALTLVANVFDEAGLHDPDHTEPAARRQSAGPVTPACSSRKR